jgi:hypothetical protein
MSKTSIVTFFFNLKGLSDSNMETRSLDFYIEKGRPTLAIKAPMYIFCDETTRPLLEDLRNSLAKDVPTVYIEKSISTYEHYNLLWETLEKTYGNKNRRVTRSYFLTMTFKLVALLISSQRDDFKTPYFCWLDLGCSHVAPDNFQTAIHKILLEPSERISACSINYRGEAELEDSADYCVNGKCGLAGTLLTADKEHIIKLYPRYMRILYEHVEKGIWYSDEQILTYCYYRHPELFNVYYGDYSSVLVNYHLIKADWESIDRFLIKEAFKNGDVDSAKRIAMKVKESLDRGALVEKPEVSQYLNYIITGSVCYNI